MRFMVTILMAFAALSAKEPDYFPLQVGNQWVYRCTQNCLSADTFTLEVVGITNFLAPDGLPYYVLRGLARDYWVRMADSSRLVARDPLGGPEERLWYNFGAAEKEEYETSVHPCNVSARITSRKLDYRGPAATGTALRIEYPNTTCNLQGLIEEIFLPFIGLARRVDVFPGSRVYDLIFARVNGVSLVPPSELSFGLSLDRAVYSVGPPGSSSAITARITLKNTTADPLHLSFPRNPYDLEIKNQAGVTVYRWSNGQEFPRPTEATVLGGELNYIVVIPIQTDFSPALPAGFYTAEARLSTVSPDLYTARAAFQIREVK